MFKIDLESNTGDPDSATLAILVLQKKLPFYLCGCLRRSYVAMVDEFYYCTIRQQPHDDTFMLFI